jgi:hypothetical protein
MTTDDGYADWLRSNPAPDLQELVGCHGGDDKITPEAWAEYDRAMADWHERRRTRRVVVRGEGADRDALCICSLPGIHEVVVPSAELLCFPNGKTKFHRPDGSIGREPGTGIVLIGAGSVRRSARTLA